tara:strand:+ start:71 stop:298 length:228 start_codon:yes stop_codon:yes gene_type:complete
MINDYQTGRLIFFDGEIGKYFYGTILSVAIDVTRNHVYMTVLNRQGEIYNLNLDEETMKQWSTSESPKCSDCIAM